MIMEEGYLTEQAEPHVDRNLRCPFCWHNFIEVIDENDGYGRHIVSFACDQEFNEDKTKVLGCGIIIELYENTVEECKQEYMTLNQRAAKVWWGDKDVPKQEAGESPS